MPPALETYRKKRSFDRTREPRGTVAKGNGFSFVVQKHAASRLHYDFRLELDGVLLSWAVPKGPSLDPKVKRLAVQTEDHPVDYAGFEGVIPAGEYGGGTVMVWDRGQWIPQGDPRAAYQKGDLKFRLEGEKLRGSWHLVRTKGGQGGEQKPAWLLFKGGDGEASATRDIAAEDASVLSGRHLEEIARDADRVWSSNRELAAPAGRRAASPAQGKRAARTGAQPTSPSRPPKNGRAAGAPPAAGATRGEFPATPLPCQLATLTRNVPEGDEWLHEVKLDGYRMVAHVDGDRVVLYTRHGLDWTARFSALAKQLGAAGLGQAVLDGEMVVLDERGVSDFQALQNGLEGGGARGRGLAYFVFDLLFLEGWDVRGVRLDARKELLRALLEGPGRAAPDVRFSDHVVGNGAATHREACKLGLEGIVCKRRDAPYRGARTTAWLKAKCSARQEFVIGGFSEPGGSRAHFGALLLGVYEAGGLRYAGKTGTGFSEASLRALHRRLAALEQPEPPFANPPRGAEARGVHWLKPDLVAEVAFAGFTTDGLVRQAVFHGLREDKPAALVKPEPARVHPRPKPTAARAGGPTLTHPDRVMYPDAGITKQQLADYYRQIAPRMLPHVAGRLLSLVRCPDGQHKSCFYQKHVQRGIAPGLVTVPILEGGVTEDYVSLTDVDGLLALVQMGVLEIHVWGSRVQQPEVPDRLVFDLDPAPEVAWKEVAAAAEEVRDRLQQIGLRSFVKSTGGKGLHVVVPLLADPKRFGWEPAKAFCKALAQAMEADAPGKYLSVATKAKRKGKLYVDYLRNARGATAVAAYSTRARPGAPVSVPLDWREINAFNPASPCALGNIAGWLGRADPWAEMKAIEQTLGREALGKL